MEFLVIFLIVTLGVLLVNIMGGTIPDVKKIPRCKPSHNWYTMIDQDGNDLGFVCIACGFKAGEE